MGLAGAAVAYGDDVLSILDVLAAGQFRHQLLVHRGDCREVEGVQALHVRETGGPDPPFHHALAAVDELPPRRRPRFLRLWPPASEVNTDRTKEKERTDENPTGIPAVPRGGSHAEGGTDYLPDPGGERSPGRALYEARILPHGRQIDFPVWIEGVARYAIEAKGGRYIIDPETGEWRLLTDAGRHRRASPPAQAWDAARSIPEVIRERFHRGAYIIAVLAFPNMEPDQVIADAAAQRHVDVIFGADRWVERLVELLDTITSSSHPPRSRSTRRWRWSCPSWRLGGPQIPSPRWSFSTSSICTSTSDPKGFRGSAT